MKYNAGDWFKSAGTALLLSSIEFTLAQLVLNFIMRLSPFVPFMLASLLAVGAGVICVMTAKGYRNRPKMSKRGGLETDAGSALLVVGVGILSIENIFSGLTGDLLPSLVRMLVPILIVLATLLSGYGFFQMRGDPDAMIFSKDKRPELPGIYWVYNPKVSAHAFAIYVTHIYNNTGIQAIFNGYPEDVYEVYGPVLWGDPVRLKVPSVIVDSK